MKELELLKHLESKAEAKVKDAETKFNEARSRLEKLEEAISQVRDHMFKVSIELEASRRTLQMVKEGNKSVTTEPDKGED